VTVPLGERITENLCLGMKKKWGQEVVCLFELDSKASKDLENPVRYEVAEHWRVLGKLVAPAHWVSVRDLSQSSFADVSDHRAIEKSLAQCGAWAAEDAMGPFARLGWFKDLCGWVQQEVAARGFQLNGNFRQLNASPSFSLIQFETDGPAVWFKAVGEPNQHEFPITVLLARLFPRRLPQVLAIQPASNGWLAAEFEGIELSDAKDLRPWQTAAKELATIQIESIAKTAQLLETGVRDVRTARLLTVIDPFLSRVDNLMATQVKVPPPVLTPSDLNLLRESIADALGCIEECDFPNALGHLDPNPGNILVASNQCAFLDWAEAYVGHPFYTFEYLLEHFRRARNTDEALQQQLTDAYVEKWKQVLSPVVIAESLAVAPLLAAFVYAVALTRDSQRLQDPKTGAYLRSLARRMSREANQIVERRLQCRT